MKRGLGKNDAINLAIGAPDIDPPSEVRDIVKAFGDYPKWRYFQTPGSEKARLNLNSFLRLQLINPLQQLSLVPGAKFGIFLSLKTVLNPGAKVGLLSPYWLSYPDISRILGLETVIFNPEIANGKLIYNVENIVHSFENDLDALILNIPNNPSGQLLSKEELIFILEQARLHNKWVLLDEVYKDLLYEGQKISVPSHEEFPNLIRIGSVSKSLAIPGLRLGYVSGSKEFMANFTLINQHLTTCVSALSNAIAEEVSLTAFEAFQKESNQLYKDRADVIIDKLNQIGFETIQPVAGFYLLIHVGSKYNNGQEAAKTLEEKGVLVTPGNAYGDAFDQYIRVCLTQPKELLLKFVSTINS